MTWCPIETAWMDRLNNIVQPFLVLLPDKTEVIARYVPVATQRALPGGDWDNRPTAYTQTLWGWKKHQGPEVHPTHWKLIDEKTDYPSLITAHYAKMVSELPVEGQDDKTT